MDVFISNPFISPGTEVEVVFEERPDGGAGFGNVPVYKTIYILFLPS
jgi:hypothetical protein